MDGAIGEPDRARYGDEVCGLPTWLRGAGQRRRNDGDRSAFAHTMRAARLESVSEAGRQARRAIASEVDLDIVVACPDYVRLDFERSPRTRPAWASWAVRCRRDVEGDEMCLLVMLIAADWETQVTCRRIVSDLPDCRTCRRAHLLRHKP